MITDPLPSIDQNLCTGCRRCVEVCPTHALAQVSEKAHLRYPDLCTYCTACEDVCPVNAISLPFLILLAPPAVANYQLPATNNQSTSSYSIRFIPL